ncbi:MAG TPA: alkaline phosphatase D family protein [Puia sp.]|nr:alkaline phosphatase D family protein [Puia sp.]
MRKLWLIFYLIPVLIAGAQPSHLNGIISGPMLGQVELRTAKIWLQVSSDVTSISLTYWKSGGETGSATTIKMSDEKLKKALSEFNPVVFELNGLDINSRYEFRFGLNELNSVATGSFRTKDLWQWRKPAPDFSFLTGSCAYFNEPAYDRPGKPYGGDSVIFESMARDSASFMLWLGDNWYTREADILSPWGLWYRASRDRAQPVLQNLLKAMPQYAIWDDHDFGPDNSGFSYGLKDVSREIFMKYWCNPYYGENQKGIYSQISYSDVDLFLTDDRYFRSADEMEDSINGKPNPDKHFLGDTQLKWLEDALVQSGATFKIIAIGSQTLNPYSDDEGYFKYSYEFYQLMDFLTRTKVKGVLFLTGDRHHSEIIRIERNNNYDLYDITVSPFTSGVAKVKGIETNNPYRVAGSLVEERNYAKIGVEGQKNDRILKVQFRGKDGKNLFSWSISEKQLMH